MSENILERSYWVVENSILGVRMPENDAEVKAICDLGVSSFISLLSGSDVNQLYETLGVDYLWLPTTDGEPPSLDSIEKAYEFFASNKEKGAIAIHCRGGRGRTGTLIAALLIKSGMKKQEALDILYKANGQHQLKKVQLEILSKIS